MNSLFYNHKRIILLILVCLMLKIAAFGKTQANNTTVGVQEVSLDLGIKFLENTGRGGHGQAFQNTSKAHKQASL